MIEFLASRLIRVIVTAVGAVTVVFFVLRCSGDPVALLTPQGATAADIQQLRHQLGFDQPLPVQYLTYLRNLAVGDWGESVKDHQPVLGLIAARIPATIELAAVAFFMVALIALPLG